MKDQIKLSIIIPAFNEVKNLKSGVLNQVIDYLKTINYSYEVLIVDDGSTDQTVKIVKSIIKNLRGFKLIENKHGGKAVTVMIGLLASKGEIALFTDMDQATPLTQVENFFPKFKDGFDIVIGTRHGRKGAPFFRRLTAWGFSVLRNSVLGLPLSDTQCGFKAFNRKSRIAIFGKMINGWEKMEAKGAAVNAGFDIEALFLAKIMGFKIAEVPVEWHYVGTKRVNLIKDSIEAIKDMLRIRFSNLLGKYDKI